MPRTRSSMKLSSKVAESTPSTSAPTMAGPNPSTLIEQDVYPNADPGFDPLTAEETYDNDDVYRCTEEDVDLYFDVKDLNLKIPTTGTNEFHHTVTAIGSMALAELAGLLYDFPYLGTNRFRRYRLIPSFFFHRPTFESSVTDINPDLLQARLDRFRYLATSFVTDLKAWIASYPDFKDCPLPFQCKVFMVYTSVDVVVHYIYDTYSERAPYGLDNPNLEPTHPMAQPRVFDPTLVDQRVGRSLFVDLLTHVTTARIKV